MDKFGTKALSHSLNNKGFISRADLIKLKKNYDYCFEIIKEMVELGNG